MLLASVVVVVLAPASNDAPARAAVARSPGVALDVGAGEKAAVGVAAVGALRSIVGAAVGRPRANAGAAAECGASTSSRTSTAWSTSEPPTARSGSLPTTRRTASQRQMA